jgi:rhodanese-related sulfurtransferase
VQLAVTDEATVLASTAGRRAFPHRSLGDGDEVDLGGLRLQALATPGHTDEHLSFLLLDGTIPVGVFTGGSLIVGSAARTDLLGDERTLDLTRAQHASLHRLAQLPDSTVVWPTHGAGSFCSAPSGGPRQSTIGEQKSTNPLLTAPTVDAFVDTLLGSLGSYPTYFERLAEVNRFGPAVITAEPVMPALTVQQVRRLLANGAVVVDVRPIDDVAAGHIPGAVAIPLRAQFATWLGWLIDPAAPIVVVRNADQDPADIVWPALNIGVELTGELSGGVPAWAAAGERTVTIALVPAHELAGPVLDIRQTSEYLSGRLPAATHVELGDLAVDPDAAPAGPLAVMCGHGERAMTAATLLERTGRHDLSVVVGGPDDWATSTGATLATGTRTPSSDR